MLCNVQSISLHLQALAVAKGYWSMGNCTCPYQHHWKYWLDADFWSACNIHVLCTLTLRHTRPLLSTDDALLPARLDYRISSNRSRVSNRSWGSKGKYHRDNCKSPSISLCSNKYKTKNLGVLNTCSSVNRVALIEAGWSDTTVLTEAGGFY